MPYKRAFSKRPRRASKRACQFCGEPVSLISCGVKEHLFAAPGTRRQPGDCNGRVYAHDETGGMECFTRDEEERMIFK